jgi:pimeloyl-ACP methyl ester carboxylesterase
MVVDKVALAFDALCGGARGELDRGGRALRWIEAGAGAPVVFEAGAMSPAVGFAACFKDLAADHRVIAYDRAGYGVSDPAPLSLDLQVGDLIAVLEAAGPSILVGHSWGGLLAQLAAWHRPDLITGLVLIDPSHESLWADFLTPEALAQAARHPTRPAADDPRSAAVLPSARELAAEVAQSVGAHEQLLIDAYLSYVETDEQLFTILDEVPMVLDQLDTLAVRRAQAVWPQVPVAVLTAMKGRPAPFVQPVMAIQEALVAAANAHHHVVPDAGHYIHLDRPDLVIQAVRDVAAES